MRIGARVWRAFGRPLATRLSAARAQARAIVWRPPVVHLYSILWNEEELLPFFFRHYDSLVDRYFLFDDRSTDGSIALLSRHPRVTWSPFVVTGDSFRVAARDHLSTAWKRSRGIADWVIVVDIDEHLHHPDGKEYLTRCQRSGLTLLPAMGYQMVSETFPAPGGTLAQSVPNGVPSSNYSKTCVFQPGAIRDIGYRVGRHKAQPTGHVVVPEVPELKLLHYKLLGEEYLLRRYAELGSRVTAEEKARKLGRHYFNERDELLAQYRRQLLAARPVLDGATGDRARHERP